jgi:hypothetical protein
VTHLTKLGLVRQVMEQLKTQDVALSAMWDSRTVAKHGDLRKSFTDLKCLMIMTARTGDAAKRSRAHARRVR